MQDLSLFTKTQASLVVQLVKNPPAMQESWVQSLGWEDSLEKGKATHSNILTRRIPQLYSPWGCKEQDTTEQFSLSPKHGLFHKEGKECEKLQGVNSVSGLLISTPPFSLFIVLFYFESWFSNFCLYSSNIWILLIDSCIHPSIHQHFSL